MSRYSIELDNKGRTDNEAVIGYDKPLRTFFLHGFIPGFGPGRAGSLAWSLP